MRIYILVIALFGLSISVSAQRDLSFYHMGAVAPQSSEFNASYFPNAGAYLSLPVVGGFHLNLHNGLKYSDMYTKIEGTDSVEFNSRNAIAQLKDGMHLGMDGSINLFQFGFRAGNKMAFSVFNNFRYVAKINYPDDLLRYLSANGNFLGETVVERDLQMYGMAFRELGLSFNYNTEIGGYKPLRLGMRLKMLKGMYYLSSNSDMAISMTTDPSDFAMNIQMQNASFQSAGFELEDDVDEIDYLRNNNNRGFALDLGAEWEINDKWSVALGLNDIGSITWKDGVKTSTLTNEQVNLDGFDLRNIRKLDRIFEDSADVWFDYETNTNSFKTKLPMRTVMSGSYKLLPKSRVTATILHDTQLGIEGITYGAGYTQEFGRILTMSGTLSRTPNKEFAFGGGFAARLAFLQLYAVVDNIEDMIAAGGAQEFNNLNLRFGLNFVIGRPDKKKKESEGDETVPVEKAPKQKKQKLGPFPDEYELHHLNDLGG